MVAPTKINFKIYQGSTFKEVLRWESNTKVYAPITGISKSAPIAITSIGHTIPVGWRVKVTNVLGMKEINSSDVYHTVTATATNTVTINEVNALAFTDYTSGGVIEYNAPNDLTGVTARMQIRAKLDSAIIEELTTENGGIVIDTALKTITIILSATKTALLTISSAVYSMEVVTPLGEVYPFITGTISIEKEITR